MNDLEFVGDYRQPHLSARQRALGHDGSSAGEFTFDDFLDIINPLQHIPVLSTLYRDITGDEIRPHARIIGDTLFGGPTGFLSSVANVFYAEVSGEDLGETVLAFFGGDDAGEPQFADGPPAPLETAAGEPDPAAVVMPESPPAILTGQDALDALFSDLRGSRPAATGLPMPADTAEEIAGPSYPLPARDSSVPPAAAAAAAPDLPESAAHPLLFAQERAGGGIADRMMQALDKYRAMAHQNETRRHQDEESPEERVLWQSDPAAAGS